MRKMLSILIPTYNYVCVTLVSDLQLQAEQLACPYEILVADDGSDEKIKLENRKMNALPHCRYIELEKNVGRARIRNILGGLAQYDRLLFMDCDGHVIRKDYLSRYLEASLHADVVCGGILHPDTLPLPEVSLRYRYEKKAEQQFTVEKRMQRPYGMFRSFNFMISRRAFELHPFDESFRDYGYEDVLLGQELEAGGIPILHIDNPLMNDDIETNPVFLRKTEEALRTLYLHRDKIRDDSGLLHLYKQLKQSKLTGAARSGFRLLRPLLRHNLLGRHPNLYGFAFYKLGYYCELECKGIPTE